MENYVIHFACGNNIEKIYGPYTSKEKAKEAIKTQANDIKNEIQHLELIEENHLRYDKMILRDKKTKIDACVFKLFKTENF